MWDDETGTLLVPYRIVGKGYPPSRGTPRSTGWDVYVPKSTIIWPGQAKMIDTGLQFFLEPGDWFCCANRSGTFLRRGLIVNNSPIDSDYRWKMEGGHVVTGQLYDDGHRYPVPLTWHLLVRNISLVPRRIRGGERLAQIVVPCAMANQVALVPANTIYSTNVTVLAQGWEAQRTGGMGSTGR